jgi:hypothetical protein
VLLQEIATGAASSAPAGFTVSGSRIFFRANDNESGVELWMIPAFSQHLHGQAATVLSRRFRGFNAKGSNSASEASLLVEGLIDPSSDARDAESPQEWVD